MAKDFVPAKDADLVAWQANMGSLTFTKRTEKTFSDFPLRTSGFVLISGFWLLASDF
jgi:hypothetical protein